MIPNPKGTPENLTYHKGRTPGVPNKFTTLKQSFLETFEALGGTKGLTEWAEKNKGTFYQYLTKLLPQETKGEMTHKFDWGEFLTKCNNGNGKGHTDRIREAVEGVSATADKVL